MANQINVSNIDSKTAEKEIRDFLSFCGKISSISLKPSENGTQTAEVVFEKESAAKTALLLDNTNLGGKEIHVTAGSGSTSAAAAHHEEEYGEDLPQEEKPKSRILAEYLAHGYKLGDQVLQRGIELDKEKGFSQKFLQSLDSFDKKTGASTRAQAVDNKYNISNTAQKGAQNAWSLASYYVNQIQGTEPGKKLHAFYTNSNRQVQDIHNEALRLAGLKKNASGEYPAEKVGVDEHGVTKTHCQCGGKDGVCGCKPGQCTCSGCAKAKEAPEGASTSGQQTATGAADQIASDTKVEPLAAQKQ